MPENLQPLEMQKEALAEKLKLKDQWQEQVKALNETGVLELLAEAQDIGIVDLRGRECPVPQVVDILANITPENLELLEQKAEQGFTKLLLVPIGLPLNILTERYKQTLLQHDTEGTLLSTDGTKLELNREDPLYIWEDYHQADIEGKLVYFPTQFTKENHQGQTKDEFINQQGAWQVLLIEDLPDLPGEGQGQVIGERKQLEANQTSTQYLKKMQEDPQYQSEQGFTPEAWLTLAITELQTKKRQIDNYHGQGKASFLTGAWFPASGLVPHGCFYRVVCQAYLDGRSPDVHYSDFSCRSSAEIKRP